jgi:hypothetical protein
MKNLASALLLSSMLSVAAHAQNFTYEQPLFPGGGQLRWSGFWVDPFDHDDSDCDSTAWEDFELPADATVVRVRWVGQAAPPLGFNISFYNQDPGTIAVQPDIFGPGSGPISEHDYTSFSQISVGGGLYQFEVDLATPMPCAANTRYFIAIVGLTPTYCAPWEWAQGTGGVHGTFWWVRGNHMYYHLGDDRAVSLATVASGPVASPFCFGDGSGSACPCTNPGSADAGCANSTGAGGVLTAAGSNGAAADDLELHATHLLPAQPALAFAGLDATGGGAGVAFGDGLRCAGTGVVRLGIRVPDAGGAATWGPGLGAVGGWQAGETRRLQVWYRDPTGSPCNSGFNLTNGLEVTFAQ